MRNTQMYQRQDRLTDAIRTIRMTPDYLIHPEGSVLIEVGQTKVLCTVTVEDKIPPFLKGKSCGWLTAEYGMLPRSTTTRMRREATTGKPAGRTQEIQRLIGRSLRQAINLEAISGIQLLVDCDVLQADGGTRTASITGGYVALHLAILKLLKEKIILENPLKEQIAAVSIGMVNGIVLMDLDYTEDSNSDSDVNIVMNASQQIIEIQGTAEKKGFNAAELLQMVDIVQKIIPMLFQAQQQAIARAKINQ